VSSPEMEVRILGLRLTAKGQRACDFSYRIAVIVTLVFGLPIGIGLGVAIATGEIPVITALVRLMTSAWK
jgi:hypothetical protein